MVPFVADGWDMDLLKPGDPSKVGRYRLIGRLGGGGMGRVFLGVSPGGRQVAVKLIRSELAGDKQFRERFAREIEAARRVGGFHTAPVVDADPDADPPWMVTAYIHGPSLQDAVAERGPLSLDQVCTLGAELAEGLAAIHACGLVHRDLKPGNVILAEDGPRIIDFGIARATEASRITTAGFVIGTCSYMSPEQVRGEVAGPASDVFSLGCTLAFAVTAHAPFGDDSIVSVVHRIVSEPPDLTGVTDERGFRQLISECLAKSPNDRPTLADVLARLTETGTDAAAALAAEPATYHRPGEPPPRDAEYPPETGDGLDSGPVDETVDETSAAQLYQPTKTMHGGDRMAPDQATKPQPSGRKLTRRDIPERDSGEAGPQPAERRFVHHAPRRTALIAAGVAVIGLLAATLGILLSSGSSKPGHLSSGHSSPASTSSASVGPPAQPEATLHDPNGSHVNGVAFSSNTVLATGDGNGSTYLWNAATGKLIATLRDPDSYSVSSVAFSPKSESFASADANGDIYLWDAGTHRLTATLQSPNGGAYSVAFSPDGDFLAAGNSDNGNTYLWNVAPGKLNATPTASFHDPGGKSVYGITFSPDGSSLAAGDTNGSIYLWNVATGKLTATFHDPDSQGLYDVAFSPNESLIAVSDAYGGVGVVYLWNTATGKLTATFHDPDGSQFADVRFNPNGRFLAAADTVGNVILWNVATGKLLARLFCPAGQALIDVAFSPDGGTIATTDTSGDAYIWNAKWLGS
jgi:predicted Ser/Thr protein kinase